jgi:hypothetical protein
MERIKTFIEREKELLKRINIDKVYIRQMMALPEVWITIKDKDYEEEYRKDYGNIVKELRSIGTEASITPVKRWIFSGSEKWGWEEISLN